MPKETFQNLSPEKREHFLEEAFREFAGHDYHAASVSRIVSSLGIAKGSVYQYFADKRDLYFHLLELASSRKLGFIRERADAAAASGGFFDFHRAVILAGAEFDFLNPRLGLLIMNAVQERDIPEISARARELGQRSLRFMEEQVRAGIARGTIRADVDPRLTATLISAATLAIGPYIEAVYSFSLVEQLRHPDRPLPFSVTQLSEAAEALMELLRNGIAAGSARI